MQLKAPIDPNRIRRITGSFSWLDHRLITQGFLSEMTPSEMLLYFFLVLVGDRNGVSFYSYDKICHLLKLDGDAYIQARNGLLKKKLIAFDGRRFQVLALPKEVVKTPKQDSRAARSAAAPQSLAEIFKQLPLTP